MLILIKKASGRTSASPGSDCNAPPVVGKGAHGGQVVVVVVVPPFVVVVVVHGHAVVSAKYPKSVCPVT